MRAKTESATMKVYEAAEMLGIGRQNAYNLAAQGELPGALRLGKRWIVSRKALESWLECKAVDTAAVSHADPG
jgi:excisionase family DNA binding protein